MIRRFLLVTVIFAAIGMSFPAYAQTTDPTLEKRIELAREMHKIRPARDQVELAVAQAAMQIPEGDRETFKTNILDGFDFERLEQTSVDAMVEIFTLAELEHMLSYYSAPEAVSIDQKFSVYEEMVMPEIMKMLDRALMQMRTGRAEK
jgi:hypothetical protein